MAQTAPLDPEHLTDYQTHLCSKVCKARCCRTGTSTPGAMSGVIVRGHEMQRLKAIAAERGIRIRFLNDAKRRFKDRWLLLRDQDECCPFLDRDTNLCTVYDDRPGVCATFPSVPFVNCLLRPGVPGRDPEVTYP